MDNTFLLNRLLKSDGTNQGQRLLAALDPENIKIDDRGLKEMLNFIYGLSKDINFFNLNNVTDGDWRSFFNFFVDPVTDEITASEEDILNVLNNKSDLDPHFALFLAFLKLFQFAQKDINSITRSRLDFYYKEVLRLDNRSAVPDKVHLILELAKNLAAHKIAEGTAFKATKTGNNIPLYKADTEIVINKASIKSLKSVFIENTGPFRIYAADTANSKDGKGKQLTEPNPKWSAFGESQLNKTSDERNMEEVKIGFAFASPMLILKEGKRIVTLTINIRDNGHVFFTDNISNDMDIFFSGEKGWVIPTSFSANITNTTLTIVASLESTDKAVVAYNKTVLKEPYETPWPVLKVMLKDGAFLYKDLYNLEVDSAKIDVTVTGVKDLVIQNDQSGLNPSKPFQPFGAIPAIDSSFYIGSTEIFQKKLSSLSLDILWNEVPASNLGNHYLSYFDGATSLANLIFTTSISLLYQDNWLKLKNPDVASGDHFLFELEDAKKPNKIPISQQTIDEAVSGHNYTRNTTLQELDSFNTSSHDGFIKLDLTGPVLSEMVLVDGVMTPVVKLKAFGHAEFPNVYAKTAIKMATAGFTGQLPKAPYTPSMKTLSLNYSSSQDITITGSNDIDQFFHVEPFGVGAIDAERPYLLPQYRREVNTIDDQLTLGNFYVGVENLVPPQNLSILFQVVEGSSDTNIIVEEEDIQWSYLANNKWIPITSLQILRNTTRALQTPGIIAFAIGSDASSQHTLMPPGIYWLRGTVTKDPAGISRLTDIKTQAVQATYVLPPPDETIADKEHLDKALPPFSIKEMLVKDAAVKSVSQPYNSFDGKSEEGDTIFYTRVSERLRHKKRALALWDYERLILDEFPSIFKVKCLTHTDDDSDLAPGAVSAVVVPSLINKNAANPLQPKVNLVTIQKIKEHVDKYIPLFVDFEVGNPVYEQLLVDFKVGFIEGKDAGYYGNLLNEEIKRFLSPWAYEEGQDITFGGKVNKSDILVFIENRDYVDFVNNFQLFHIFDGVDKIGNGIGEMAIAIDFIIDGPVHPGISEMVIGDDFVVGRSVEVAYAAGPRSILVSAPDHRITVLKAGEYKCEGTEYAGIGYWAIGVDFIIQ